MNVSTISVESIKRLGVWPSPRPKPQMWNRLEVILKVSERCNIDCDYCYFFHAGDESFRQHPAYMSHDTVEQVGAFLARTAAESGIDFVQIDFHGGEPMMLKKSRFDAMCTSLREQLANVPTLQLAMQSNGMLIDDEWIELIGRHDIAMGISLDGTREYNDVHRLDHRGRGTYDATVAGIRKLLAAFKDGRLKGGGVSLSCVVGPEQDAKRVLSHFVDELGCTSVNFVFPMTPHDTFDRATTAWVTRYMCDLFDEWVARKDRRIKIRFLDRLFNLLVGGPTGLARHKAYTGASTAMTISSNGELGGADDERVATYAFGSGHFASGDHTLSDFYATPAMQRYSRETSSRHSTCKACCWSRVCDAGDGFGSATDRYSAAQGFDNVSVYCEAYTALLVRMTEYAMSKGIPFSHLQTVLTTEEPQAA